MTVMFVATCDFDNDTMDPRVVLPNMLTAVREHFDFIEAEQKFDKASMMTGGPNGENVHVVSSATLSVEDEPTTGVH